MSWSRNAYDDDELAFAASLERFVAKEITPRRETSEAQVWLKAGEAGLLGTAIPEAYGGSGAGPLYPFLVGEAIASTGFFYAGFGIQDIVAFYLLRYGSEAQKQRWLPELCAGRKVAAIAMTEPKGGSDLKTLATSAVRSGEDYVLNGSKTFITNGPTCDHVVVAARTDAEAGPRGVTRSWSRPARRASPRARPSRRSASSPRTPASCSSRTPACPPRTGWAAKAPGSRP